MQEGGQHNADACHPEPPRRENRPHLRPVDRRLELIMVRSIGVTVGVAVRVRDRQPRRHGTIHERCRRGRRRPFESNAALLHSATPHDCVAGHLRLHHPPGPASLCSTRTAGRRWYIMAHVCHRRSAIAVRRSPQTVRSTSGVNRILADPRWTSPPGR